MSEFDLEAIVKSEIQDAADYIDTTISPERAEATNFYKGEPFGNEKDGQSKFISKDVHDTI